MRSIASTVKLADSDDEVIHSTKSKVKKEVKAKEVKAKKESKEPEEVKAKKESKEPKEVKAKKEPKEVKAKKEPKEVKGKKESKAKKEPIQNDLEDIDEIEVKKFDFKGKTYLKSNMNVIYDIKSEEAIGVWNESNNEIEFKELEDEDEYDSANE